MAGAEALTAVYDRIAGLLAAEFREIHAAVGSIEQPPASGSAARAIDESAVARQEPVEASRESAVDRPDVYVSYPRAGSVLREWIYRFVELLAAATTAQLGHRLRFFLDMEHHADAEFDRVRPVMERSRISLAILTPHYLASSWCLAEWQAFEDREQAEARALMVPVVLRGVSAPPIRFSERVAIDGSRVDLSDTNNSAMAALVEKTANEVVATLEGRPLPQLTRDRQLKTGLARRSVEPAGQRHRILFLAANPQSAGPLALEVEAREISDVLMRAPLRDQLELHTTWAATPVDLLYAMRKVRPAVVHFSGHGASDGLYLEGPDRLSQVVSTQALAQVMGVAGGDLRLVVLSACYSEKQAAALSEVVDCVVGVVATISDRAAIAFSAGFYQALAAGASVAEACKAGGGAMTLARADGDPGPSVHLRTRPGVQADATFLTARPPPPKPRSRARRGGAR